MSDYHILDRRTHDINVAFHVPVEDSTNLASKSLRTAMGEDNHSTTSVVPGISAEEIANLVDYVIVEEVRSVGLGANRLTLSDTEGAAETASPLVEAEVQSALIAKYAVWGDSKDVVR